VKWYRLAAEQGYADAQFNLGVMCDNGTGVTQDDKAAVKWYTLAAEQGDADAQSNLGVMYGTGKGVIQNYVYAHVWLSIAASSGEGGNASKNRDVIAKRMNSTHIFKAQKLAQECVRNKYKGC
jgi:TPR repeat protein